MLCTHVFASVEWLSLALQVDGAVEGGGDGGGGGGDVLWASIPAARGVVESAFHPCLGYH